MNIKFVKALRAVGERALVLDDYDLNCLLITLGATTMDFPARVYCDLINAKSKIEDGTRILDQPERRTMGIEAPYTLRETRAVGIEVDVGDGPVRPVWRKITVLVPDGEIPGDTWDQMTREAKQQFTSDEGDAHD